MGVCGWGGLGGTRGEMVGGGGGGGREEGETSLSFLTAGETLIYTPTVAQWGTASVVPLQAVT